MKRKMIVSQSTNTSISNIILFKYLPYWPLFAVLSVLFLVIAFLYLRYQQPIYDITATVVISDQAKGAGEAESIRSLNLYAANKIVENEVEVLQSRTLVNSVVDSLRLYAPVYEKGKIKPASAYTTSPVMVEVSRPGLIDEKKELGFTFNSADSTVRMENKVFRLNQWVTFSYATIRFIRNPHQTGFSVRPLYFDLVPPKVAALNVSNGLDVAAGSKLSTIVTVHYKDEVPRRGEDIVNALLSGYIRQSVLNNNQLASTTLAFVEGRLRSVEHDLDSIERSIQAYKSNQGIVDVSEQGKIYLQNVSEANRQLADLNMQMAVLDQVEQYVVRHNRTGIVPTTLGINDPVLADLLQKLNDLELQYTELRTSTGENHPLTKSVENEIQKIRPQIINIVQNQRARIQASRSNLNNTSGQYSATLRSLPAKERGLLEISRQQAIKNDIYAQLLQKREEAALSNSSTIPDSRVVDWAQAGVRPVSSKKYIGIAAALVLALISTIAYVFLREGMTNKVLFRSGMETLTAIPVIEEIAYRVRKRGVNAAMVSDPVLSSQFGQLQASLGLLQNVSSRRKFLVTSGMPGEGKSFVASQFARSLALSGKRTVLVDLNLYTATTSESYGLASAKGYRNFIREQGRIEEMIQTTRIENLFVLPAGGRLDNPLPQLLNSRTADLFNELEQRFEYIVVDSPSLEVATDAFAIARLCDTVLLVVRYGITPKVWLQKLDADPRIQGLPDTLIVFNGIKPRGLIKRYYGYGYGYGYEKILENSRCHKEVPV